MDTGRTYRINAVSEMTGIPAPTLRAWERRYGFPKPQRTDSRYRVYTDADIAMVRRMKELTVSGMAPSDSARLLIAEPDAPRTEPAGGTPSEAGDAFTAAVERIYVASAAMAIDTLEAELRAALTLGDAVQVVQHVFIPVLARIGEGWEAGELSVAHEHLASEAITHVTRDLLRLVPLRRSRKTVLLACFAEEQHVMPLYAAALRFAELGIRPEVLGLRTPPEAVAAAVKERVPDMIGLSITVPPDPARTDDWIQRYAAAAGARPWMVGGAGAESVRSKVEAAGGIVAPSGATEMADVIRVAMATGRGTSAKS